MTTTPDSPVPDAFREDVARAVSILKEAGCTEVYLFGSAARGEVREGSDLDFAVRGCPPARFYHVVGQLLMELEHLSDLVDLDAHAAFARHLEAIGDLVRVA